MKEKSNRDKKTLYVCLVDMTDAYGSIEYGILKPIMEQMGFAKTMVKTVMELMEGHTIHVKTHYGLTRGIKIKKGAPQGDPISPLIYNIYSEPIMRMIERKQIGFQMESKTINIKAYADDNTLIASTKEDMEEVLETFTNVAILLNLKINTKK